MNEDMAILPPELPLVSILIPAFNHARFIRRCLDSVLEDPYPRKELIVIDDGSTDGTANRIAEWIAEHDGQLMIEYVRRENRGIAATLNELAARARGLFLRLGASDDYFLPGGLAVQVGYLMAHPGKWAVIGDSLVVDEDGETLHASAMRDLHRADKRLYQSEEGICRAVICQWAVGGPVALIRRNALETVAGWSEGLRIDDWDFFLRLIAHGALGFVDVRVCAYRLHGTNVSRTRHTATRLLYLGESQRIAVERMALFNEPYRTLLRAQSHFIGAKMAFLQRRFAGLGLHLFAYLVLVLIAKIRPSFAHLVVERA